MHEKLCNKKGISRDFKLTSAKNLQKLYFLKIDCIPAKFVLGWRNLEIFLRFGRDTSVCHLQPRSKINGEMIIFAGKWHFLVIRKGLNFGLKPEKQVQTKNHTVDWVLQGWSEIIEKNAKNGVVLEATSN